MADRADELAEEVNRCIGPTQIVDMHGARPLPENVAAVAALSELVALAKKAEEGIAIGREQFRAERDAAEARAQDSLERAEEWRAAFGFEPLSDPEVAREFVRALAEAASVAEARADRLEAALRRIDAECQANLDASDGPNSGPMADAANMAREALASPLGKHPVAKAGACTICAALAAFERAAGEQA